MELVLLILLACGIFAVILVLRRRTRVTTEPGPATPERGAEDPRFRGLGRGGLAPHGTPDREERAAEDDAAGSTDRRD